MIYQIKNFVEADLGEVRLNHNNGFTTENVPEEGTYNVDVNQAVISVTVNGVTVPVGEVDCVTITPNVRVKVKPQQSFVDILDASEQ